MPFQRKNQPAIGTKDRYPGFIEPALASSIEKVPGGKWEIRKVRAAREKVLTRTPPPVEGAEFAAPVSTYSVPSPRGGGL